MAGGYAGRAGDSSGVQHEKLGKSKLITTHLPDGIALINEEERSWIDKVVRNDLSRWARVPRERREAIHFLIVGDSALARARL